MFVSYLLLNYKKSGSAINILYPFEESLPSTTIILNGEQRITMVFS